MELFILLTSSSAPIPWAELPWGAIIAGFLALVAIVTFIVRVDSRSSHNKKSLDSINPKVDDMTVTVSALQTKVESNSTIILNLSNKLTKVSENVERIVDHLFPGDIANRISAIKSPIALTDFGFEIVKVSGGQAFIVDHFDELYNLFEFDSYSSYLDIQDRSYRIISDSVDRPEFKRIKDFIYNSPKYKDTTINLGVMVEALGLYIRDLVIERFEKENPDNDLNYIQEDEPSGDNK